MKTIAVSGTPGTGKTTLSKKLARALKFEYVNVTEEVKKNKLSSGYDKKRKCEIVDIKKLNNFLIKKIKTSKRGLVIDSIFSHYLDKKYVDLCIVTTCDIKELKKRLKERKYSNDKIDENIEVEIFDTFIVEAKERKHNLLIVNTTRGYNIKDIVNYVKR